MFKYMGGKNMPIHEIRIPAEFQQIFYCEMHLVKGTQWIVMIKRKG